MHPFTYLAHPLNPKYMKPVIVRLLSKSNSKLPQVKVVVMEMQRKITAREDRLSNLPDAILIHILSMLPGWNNKEVVRTSVLSTRWRFIWKSVPMSLDFDFPILGSENDNLFYLASIHRELYYWRNCEKIEKFRLWRLRYEDRFAKDIDLWVHFAFKVSNVESFTLGVLDTNDQRYEFPQFAYKNASLSDLALWYCQLNPTGSVNWSSLVSLSFGYLKLTDDVMEKVLSGCPNLECLELDGVEGIHRLEISSVKLRELTIQDYGNENHDLEILAPYIKKLELLGCCGEIRIRQRNVASLVTAVLRLDFAFDNLKKECRYLKDLLHGIANVENLELGSWCIEFLSILELKGWQPPPSNWKFIELPALQQLDLPGLCSFLPCSLDLEALVIDWRYNDEERDLLSRYTNEDEQIRRFETRNFNCSFPHLKAIEIINFHGPLSENKSLLPLVKYFLKHATVLEEVVIDTIFKESDMLDHFEMTQELLSFPRSSPHASVVFSYR